MVTQRVQVILDMRRRVRLRVTEDRIDRKPCQVRAVLVITDLVDVFGFREYCRRRSQEPITRIVHVDIGCRTLKVIDIRRSDSTYIVRVTRNQVRKLSVQRERGRRCGVDPRNLVNRIGQPLHLRLPTTINTPDRVRQRLGTRVDLRCQRPLAQVHDRTADNKVPVEFILKVRSEQRLTLHRERSLVLQFDIDIRTGLQNRGVENGHSTHGVVHSIVHVLNKRRTARRHRHTSARHVHRAQTDLAAVRAFVLTRQMELVLFAQLLRHNKRGIIQLLETVFGS